MKFIIRIIFCLLIFLSFSMFTSKTFAADQGNIGAYPTNYDVNNPKTKSWFIYELTGGVTKEDSITVVNNSSKKLDIKIYPVDATTTRDGAIALLNQSQQQSDVGSWVHLSKDVVTLAAHARVDVPFTITIPKNVTVGDHAGGIIIQEATKANNTSQGMGLNIVSRVGTRIYETVPGAKVVNLDVRDLQYKIIDNHLVFTFTMENEGNIILTPTGSLEVKDSSGKHFDTISLGNLGSIFPGKPTVITATSTKDAPLFGRYTATVTINYAPTKAISKTMAFFIYVKDWKAAALPVGGVIFLLILLFNIRKIFSHGHRIKKSRATKETIKAARLAPAYVPALEENIEAVFIAKHIKLLVMIISFGVIVLSCLFAFILHDFVLSKVIAQGNSPTAQLTQTQEQKTIATTPALSPTDIPVAKSDIKVTVLNGTGKAGAAKVVGHTLITDGFTVVKTGNAQEDATTTTIKYPAGKIDGANQLQEALKSDYPQITQEESTDSAEFTIVLGK